MNISRPPEHRWKPTHYTHTANPPSARRPYFGAIYVKGGKLDGLFTPSKRVNDVTPMPSTGPIIRAKEPSAYTPSTDYVRENFLPVPSDLNTLSDIHSDDEYCEESAKAFSRWLAKHDDEIQAQAWDSGYHSGYDDGRFGTKETTSYESEGK